MTQTLTLDMLQSTGMGALALLLGMWLTRHIGWLQKFCIPSPVSGGIIFVSPVIESTPAFRSRTFYKL